MILKGSDDLSSLLPAGTLQIDVCPEIYDEIAGQVEVDGSHSEWPKTLVHATENNLNLLRNVPLGVELSFLTKLGYIRARWKLFNSSLLHVQVYLIPTDHPSSPKNFRAKYSHNDISKARDYLSRLFPRINQASQAWDKPTLPDDPFKPFLPVSENITLAEIFSSLPPPILHPSKFLQGVDPRIRRYYSQALTWNKPPGMITSLYKYQVRTVANMLQRELQPGLIPDPSYIPVRGVRDQRIFYFQPSTMEILSEPPPRYPVPSGGILCEEMGTGKTCIILGLIMATKDHIAQPDERSWSPDDKVILSEVALRTFPSPNFKRARENANQPISPGTQPTLAELLVHYIRVTPLVLTHLDKKLKDVPVLLKNKIVQTTTECVPFYRLDVTQEFKELRTSPRKTFMNRRWKQFYLTSATLIVVPQAIVVQWNSEINKHCDTDVRVLFLSDDNKTRRNIPPAPQLASEYDIVLLTHERLSRYKEKKDALIRTTHCDCQQLNEDIRVPKCLCKENEYFPLMQVRWKRLVVDEGHKMGTRGNYAIKCQQFNAAHRWIITGTPTPNLMGLGLGKAESTGAAAKREEEEANATYVSDDDDDDKEEDDPDLECDALDTRPRPWTKEERVDLTILGDYLTRFFDFAAYLGDNKFGEKVVKPIMHHTGPLPGSINVLRNLMILMMFRHPIEVIESEIPGLLPRLEEKVVKLKFQPLAAKTYNVLQSVIAVNAVDSERQHQDYLFHPSSRTELRTALENLSQTLFWKTDQEMFLIWGAIQRSKIAETNAMNRNVSASDLELVRESLRIQQHAASDQAWGEIMLNEDFVFSVRGFSETLGEAWLKIKSVSFDSHDPYLDTDRLLAIQHILHVSPLISEENLVIRAKEQCELEEQWKEMSRAKKRRLKKQNLGDKHHKLLQHRRSEQFNRIPETNLETRVPPIVLHKSGSSKVNYILRKVLKHSPKHKFLIFSSMPLSLAYLADALRLAQIPFLSHVSTGMKNSQRQSNVVTFETDTKCRVLLVELKLGGRGLNLVSASRIIFCEPVWHGDIESQAIKRAHRIGNKCEKIKVVTLVMAGTYEEEMVSRRRALLNQAQQQASSFELDVNMRRVLENTKFITEEHIEDENDTSNVIDIPLARRKRRSFNYEMQHDEIEVKEEEVEEENSIRPLKKRQRVHFDGDAQ